MEKKPTQILEEEHHLIQQVVGAMAGLADRLSEGQEAGKETLVGLVDFMRIFVDKCHHEKEDKHLFPLLVMKGVPVVGCPIGVLSHEHEAGRKLTADLGAAVESYLRDASGTRHILVTSLRDAVALYPGHIWKENYLLFPMSNKILDDNEQQELLKQFETVESRLPADTHQRFERFAEKLAHLTQGR